MPPNTTRDKMVLIMNIAQQIFTDSPLAQVVVDPFQDKILLANPSAEILLWSKPEQLHSKSFSLFFAGIFPELITLTQEVLENGKAWYSELTLRSPDGAHHCVVDITGFVTSDCQNQTITFYLQNREEIDRHRDAADAHQHYVSGISQWRRVEKVFQEIEKDNQLILTAAGEGIYGVDGEGRTTFVNPAAEELLGWSADELVGKDIHPIIHHSHESGCHYPSNQCPIYAAFCDGIVHRVVDEVFWHKNGNPIPVEYTS
jgi:PAS domain S-box-containing protein